MKIYHIAAMNQDRVIGKDGDIPWYLPDDWKRFKELTYGHPVVMGRKTFESICPHAPLKGRMNVVLTSQDQLYFDGRPVPEPEDVNTELVLASSVDEALSMCGGYHEVYIIGGQRVYEDTLHLADELRLTLVDKEVDGGDTFYPVFDGEDWVEVFRDEQDSHVYVDYVRCPT